MSRPLRLLYAGRVERRKGVHTAVAALAGLQLAGVDARLRIVGWRHPEYARELRALAEKESVSGLIEWVEPQPHEAMPDVYREADILLFPSIWREPFGLAPLEAMATGCLVVATGAGGSGEYLRDAENALLFACDDARAATEAIVRLTRDADLVAKLRRGGRETVRRLSFDTAAAAYNEVILAAVAADPRRR